MHSTWNIDPSARRFRPTTSATRPPIPASTSSKMSPGAPAPPTRSPSPAESRAPNVSVLMASMMRDSSPPDTTRTRGRKSSPGLGDTKNSGASNLLPVHDDSSWASANRTSKRVRSIGEVDTAARTVRVGPGVVPARLNRHLAPSGLHFAPDPSSSAWCTIGGMVANNAGGSHTVGHGATRDNVAKGRTKFALEPLEQRKALFHVLQFRRRGVDLVDIAAQKDRQVLELRLDRVARIEVRLKLRVDRGQFADAPPDMPQARQHGIIAFIERRVALDTQPLDALRARQHLPQRSELDVFSRVAWLSAFSPARSSSANWNASSS